MQELELSILLLALTGLLGILYKKLQYDAIVNALHLNSEVIVEIRISNISRMRISMSHVNIINCGFEFWWI